MPIPKKGGKQMCQSKSASTLKDRIYVPEHDQMPEEQGIPCWDCEREIVATTGRNGNCWMPKDIAGYSERRFGRILCVACQEKARNEH